MQDQTFAKHLTAIVFATIAGLTLAMAISTLPVFNTSERAQRDYAESVCDQAHSEIGGKSEDNCARLQLATGTTYSCNITGTNCNLKDN